MTVVPFDFAALPRVSRQEIEGREHLRSARVSAGPIALALEKLLGCDVALEVARVLPFAGTDGVAIAFAPSHDETRAFVVALEPALARELVARALKHPLSLADPSKTAGHDVHGAVAAVLLAALRTSGAALRIVDAATPAFTAFLAVTIAGATFDARVSFPPVPLVPGIPDLDRLGDAPIALRIVASQCEVARAELEALGPGDVLMPPAGWMDDGVDLVAPGEERGLRARLAFGSKVVLRTEPSASLPMSTDSQTPVDVALEAPVVVRIEVGSVEMKAREWAALAAGDVIRTGVKLGAPAVLRIGGVAVAHGELVTVDGETGVRIVGTIK